MSAITLRAVRRSQYWITYSPTEITWEGLMQHSPNEIKEKLLKALDKDNNVVDMGTVMEVITVLEKMQITKEALERTRLGKYINELRKRTNNESLARRAKKLVRSWQKLIIPIENSINGERIVHTTALAAESGLNLMPTNKAASPATINHKLHHHHHRNRSNSPIRVTSPIDSYCSSTSTSPALALGYQVSRPNTPSVFAPKTKIASPDKENPTANVVPRQISPQLQQANKVNDLNETLSRHSEPENNFHKHKNARTTTLSTTNDKVICSSHSLNVDVVAKTNAANKRLRKDDCDGPNKKMCAETSNNTNCKHAVGAVNGVEYGDSNDSTRSIQEDFQENETKVPSESTAAMSLTRKVVNSKKKEASDSLKEKLATHTRANKVKTTAQLIEDLKAKNTSVSTLNVSSLLTCTNNDLDKASGSRASPVYPRRGVNNVLDGDHDMNKTKTEMMEKFLLSSVGSDSVDGFDNSRSSLPKPDSPTEKVDLVDPVELILARLPPVNVDEIVWDDEDGEDVEGAAKEEKEVTDDVLNRFHAEPWECVNGNYDHEQEFREWHQALSLRSCNEELLHILPYVNID